MFWKHWVCVGKVGEWGLEMGGGCSPAPPQLGRSPMPELLNGNYHMKMSNDPHRKRICKSLTEGTTPPPWKLIPSLTGCLIINQKLVTTPALIILHLYEHSQLWLSWFSSLKWFVPHSVLCGIQQVCTTIAHSILHI